MYDTTDCFGRPISGAEANTIQPVATFQTKTMVTKVEDALQGYSIKSAAVFMNGVNNGETVSDFAALADKTMNSLLVEVFATDKEIDRITLIALSLGMVTDVDSEKSTAKIVSIGYPMMDALPFTAPGFSKNDIVVFTDSFDTTTFKATIHSAALAPRVNAVLSSYTGSTLTDGSFVASDKTYLYSAVNSLEYKYGVYPEGFPPGTLIDAAAYVFDGGNLGDEITIFFDPKGYVMHIVNSHNLENFYNKVVAISRKSNEDASIDDSETETDSDIVGSGALAGSWKIVVKVPGGEQPGVFYFSVDGNTLEGRMTNSDGVTDISNGKIKGNEFAFKIKLKTPVGEMKFNVNGTVDGNKLSGKWKMLMGSFDFSGVRL